MFCLFKLQVTVIVKAIPHNWMVLIAPGLCLVLHEVALVWNKLIASKQRFHLKRFPVAKITFLSQQSIRQRLVACPRAWGLRGWFFLLSRDGQGSPWRSVKAGDRTEVHFVRAVHAVAYKRHSDWGKMHSYLMRSAGFKTNFHERPFAVSCNRFSIRYGSIAMLAYRS